MNLEATTANAEREPYHTQIHRALGNLRDAIDGLAELKDKIEHDEMCQAEKGVDPPAPPLGGLLQGASGDIRQEAERIRGLIIDIRSLLF